MGSTPLFGVGAGAHSVQSPTSQTPSFSRTVTFPNRQAIIQSLPDIETELPPLIRILEIYLRESDSLFKEVVALNDVYFTGQRPIVGIGHHFVVYASPFGKQDKVPERVAKANGEVYCIKAPNMDNRTDDRRFQMEYYRTVLQELRVMSHPCLKNHDNIIGLLGVDFMEDYDDYKLPWPMLLLEYSEFGTLNAFQEDMGHFSPFCIRNFLLDIAIGLQCLHSCNIIHGDVKSENVLICGHSERQYVAKLSDFGLSIINPSETEEHYLPGHTWLWSAPEALQQLSVQGLKQTDVFSFGLTAWRVWSGRHDPFVLVPRNAVAAGNQMQFVHHLKQSPMLCHMAIQTLSGHPNLDVINPVFSATLAANPTQRDLNSAISALLKNHDSRTGVFDSTPPIINGKWETDSEVAMATLIESFSSNVISLLTRQSVIYALLDDLDTLTFSGNPVASLAGKLYFDIMTSPTVTLGDKSPVNQSRVLQRLCDLGSITGRAIAHAHCEFSHQPILSNFNTSWLEEAAWNNSFFAIDTLKRNFPQQYLEWKRKIEESASKASSGPVAEADRMLLAYCRTGNVSQCLKLLDEGASAVSDWDEPGALHFLALHVQDEEIPVLAHRLMDAGASVDHWEGSEYDVDWLYGRCFGTPLHWAILFHNLPLVRVFTDKDKNPSKDNVRRAHFIAAAMNFFDILEILRDWSTDGIVVSQLWNAAAENNELFLARRFRHGDNIDMAMSQTFEILFMMESPSKDQLSLNTGLLNVAIVQNHVRLVEYILHRFDLPRGKSMPRQLQDMLVSVVMCGFREMFDILCENGWFNGNDRFGETDKFTGIQMCLAVRQRDPFFIQQYIEWGCHVDEFGDSQTAEWTPFGMSVQCGFYEIATLLLSYGADKDVPTGWVGGSTPAFRLLHTWPDVPISRIRYFLEEMPRQGFGHISLIGWPANGANIFYAFSMSSWSYYRNGDKLGESMKYFLSKLGDRTCLNVLDRYGHTALSQACLCGNIEVVRILIESGADVNPMTVRAPLSAAIEWRQQWAENERRAMSRRVPGELRHARKVRMRAEELEHLLRINGARERSLLEDQQIIMTRGFRVPTMEMLFEIASGAIDTSSRADPAAMNPHPSRHSDFRIHRGNANPTQLLFRKIGRGIDNLFGAAPKTRRVPPNTTVARYSPHTCFPWVPCGFAHGPPSSTQLTAIQHPQRPPQQSPPPPSNHIVEWSTGRSTLVVSNPASQQHFPHLPTRFGGQTPQSSPDITMDEHLSPTSRSFSPIVHSTPSAPLRNHPHGPMTLPGMPNVHMSTPVYHQPSTPVTIARTSNTATQWQPPEVLSSPQRPPNYSHSNGPPPMHPRSWEAIVDRLRSAVTALRSSPSLSRCSSTDDLYSFPTQSTPPPSAKGNPQNAQIIELVREEFLDRIQLEYRASGIEEVGDIALIESSVVDILGTDLMKEMDVTFVPELEENGRQLWMHFCCLDGKK